LKERRDSSYSTSSDELLEYQMKSMSAAGVGLFAAVAKGAKVDNHSFESSVTGNNATAGAVEEIKLEGMTTKD